MNKINKKNIYTVIYLISIFLGIYATLIIDSIIIIQFINIQNKVKNFETNFDFDKFNDKINNFENQFNYLVNKINYYENYSQDFLKNNFNNFSSTLYVANNILNKLNYIENTINQINNNINKTYILLYNPGINVP